VGKVLSYIKYHNQRSQIKESRIGSFYNDTLDTNFWTRKEDRSGKSYWEFDQRVRRKLIRIAKDFFAKFDGILRQKDIVDIQLTGSLSNYNYTPQSDLDVHVIVNLEGINDENPKILKSAVDGIRFIWNLRHDIKIRGYDVELYVQDSKEPHSASGLFSLLNNEWIKSPVFDPPEIDENDVNKKADSIAYEINNIQSKLSISPLPKNSRELHKRAIKLKEKIHKMRKESLNKGGEFSVGNLAYKKLRNEGYIEKIIEIISDSYDNIYSEK
jgi:hypothetical protein